MIKKILAVLLLFSYMTPSYAIVCDEFVENSLSSDLTIPKYQYQPIEDDFAQKNQQENQPCQKALPIEDSFAQANHNVSKPKEKIIIEEVLPSVDSSVTNLPQKSILESDMSIEIPIYIKSLELITTRQKREEGDFVEFETVDKVSIQGKVYPKGTKVRGRIETISMNYSFGVPAYIVIGHFSIEDTQLSGEIKKTGANRSLWVKPTSYVTLLLFGIGILIMPIRGGHAKIRPSQTYKIYYVE
jgi:hypothetical protein